MLTLCPECALQVSDKADFCPHCGYPFRQSKPKYKRTSKHKKLPNGFGQITEIKDKKLRNPFRVMVTTGHDEKGQPIQKTLKPKGYFKTYNEAYSALVEYNKNPYDLNNILTVKNLYEKWLPIYSKTLKCEGSIRSVTSSWAYCSSVYDVPLRQLRPRHIKFCIEEGTAIVKGEKKSTSPSTKKHIKSLFNMMLDYAVEYELTDKNVARLFSLSEEVEEDIEGNRIEHIAFTPEELSVLWKNTGNQIVDMILVQCYMGWRPSEITSISIDKVDLYKNIIVGGIKSPAGIDRSVPIHSLVKDIVSKYYSIAVESLSRNLFCYKGEAMTYAQYRIEFNNVITELGLKTKHRPHDGRKTYITMAKFYKIDEYAIKKIVGHEISDITEKIYTERPQSWLNEETEKIKDNYFM